MYKIERNMMTDFRKAFIEFAIQQKVLRFGEYITKAGRPSPYFFNAGLFHNGAAVYQLAQFYTQAILAAKVEFDLLFGPAYKGIVLASSTAMVLSQHGKDVPFCFNRKEAKDHGEGGVLIGAPLEGRVLIIDDVISAGTSVGESMRLIKAAGAEACGVVIALNRMERGAGSRSAIQEVEDSYGIPVISIASLDDLIAYLETMPELHNTLEKIMAYRQQYGIQ